MPRLFASLSRSKKPKERAHHDYPAYADYGRYEQQPYEQHHEQYYGQQYEQPPPSQHRVVPQMEPRNPHGSWGEEFVEYPESYSGLGDQRRSDSRRRRPSVREYSVHSESTVTPLDNHYDHHYGRDNAVPIVQRESSLSRIQEAFADYGSSSRPVTQVNLPQPTPRPSPRDAVVPPVPPPMVPAEVRNVYAGSRPPVLVPNTSVHSMEPEFVRSASQHRGRSHDRHHSSSRREYYSRDRSPPSDRTLEDEQDYPPCVVVVERGRNGKKDTYYVIPGGAPVIFEDDEGRELTRVGDFTGRYKPRRQRPVIIEDEHGNEIGRLGFDDESSLDYAYRDRPEADFHERDREYNYRHRHRDYHDDRSSRRTPPSRGYDSRDYQRNREDHYDAPSSHGANHRDSPSSHRMDNRDAPSSHRADYRDSLSSRRPSPRTAPNVVFIPPSNTSRSSSRHSGSSSRRQYQESHRSGSTSRSHDSGSVIHLNDFHRRPSGSVSSASSGKRSYGSSNHRR